MCICACGPRGPVAAPAPPAVDGGWRTLRAEHQVTVDTHGETRHLRGAIAVERPDRFRLRALGPAGITLFDVVSLAGQARVLESLRAAPGLATLAPSLAADLDAAYDLAPRPANRTITVERDAVVVREPGRMVRLSAFVAPPGTTHSYASRIDVQSESSGGYRVHIDVGETTLDDALDPALFQ